jgi:zinc protease
VKPDFAAARQVVFPAPPPREEFTVETEIPKALVLVYWPTTDNTDIHRTRRLGLLAGVFEDRLRVVVREKLGDAYSPSASSAASDTYRGYGVFQAAVEVDPARTSLVQDAILTIAAELHAGGVTEEELERARAPVLTSIRESWRRNEYWLNSVLTQAQEKPQYLDYARTREPDFESITAAELSALAKEFLAPDRSARFIVRPVVSPSQ